MRWVIYLAAALMLLSVTLAEQVSAKSPQEILEEETAMTYFCTPFVIIVDVAASRHKLKIQLMPDVAREAPVTYDQQGKLKTVLNGLMEQMKLAYSVEEDGIVIHRPGKYRLLPIPVPAPDADPGLVKALDEEARFEFTGTPLATAIDRIMERHKIKIALAAGIEKYSGVTYYGRGPLKYELRSLLRPLDLTYELTSNSVLIQPIAPPQDSPGEASNVKADAGRLSDSATVAPRTDEPKAKLPAGMTESTSPAASRGAVTYEFTARIKDSGGIYFFVPGTTMTGKFTYDTDAARLPLMRHDPERLSRYKSPKNELVIEYQGAQFIGIGDVLVDVSAQSALESFVVKALDVRMPSGWEMDHSSESDSYGIALTNVPSEEVFPNAQLPRELVLRQFATREVGLGFSTGLRYPRGRIDGSARVRATIESLTLRRDASNAESPPNDLKQNVVNEIGGSRTSPQGSSSPSSNDSGQASVGTPTQSQSAAPMAEPTGQSVDPANLPDASIAVSYRFAARIKDNGGVAWFKTGTVITGQFTYDVDATPLSSRVPNAKRYLSPRNRLVFEYEQERFVGAGDIQVKIGALTQSESFVIRADDLELPSGWVINRAGRFDGYGIGLQNVPPRGVLQDARVPASLELSQFVTSRELQLSFYHGVSYPQGRVDRPALVRADVESLTRITLDGDSHNESTSSRP